jgi:hypothetical protein
MVPWLAGFADELVKLSSSSIPELKEALQVAKQENKPTDRRLLGQLRGRGAPVSRDYLASAIIGALAVPSVGIAGSAIARALHNRSVLRAVAAASGRGNKHQIMKELKGGSLIGRARPDLPASKRPVITGGELLASSASGALGGSVVQMLRDRVSGSVRTDSNR